VLGRCSSELGRKGRGPFPAGGRKAGRPAWPSRRQRSGGRCATETDGGAADWTRVAPSGLGMVRFSRGFEEGRPAVELGGRIGFLPRRRPGGPPATGWCSSSSRVTGRQQLPAVASSSGESERRCSAAPAAARRRRRLRLDAGERGG
jgi:hypothetical protein